MIVVITSCAPVCALSTPAIPPQIAPPIMPATNATSRCRPEGSDQPKPTYPAKRAPMMSWPWAPMLNRPARKARETPSPAQISGAARSTVMLRALVLPTEPLTRAAYDEEMASHDRPKKSWG